MNDDDDDDDDDDNDDDYDESQEQVSGGDGDGECQGSSHILTLQREKLLAMKRYSGFLKRPEILETVYRLPLNI